MFDPSKFLDFAHRLLKERDRFDEDASNRTIINRAYFSSLLLTKTKLNKPEEPFPSDNKIHKIAVEKLGKIDDNLGDLLFTLHENRLKSDLDLDYDPSKEVIDSIGIADYLKEQIDDL